MRDKHIISLLDSDRFGSWSAPDASYIETHVADCDHCRQAYVAAKATAVLLQARAAEAIEPAPFFSTRVMALIREEQNAPALTDLGAMWKAARGFVFSALSVVVLLTGLTFLTPQPNSGDQAMMSGQVNYSTEGIVFGDEVSRIDESLSDEQVVDVVFTPEEADATNQK